MIKPTINLQCVVGFTGTREGMAGNQMDTVAGLLTLATEFHHGDCVGADEEAHTMILHPLKPSLRKVVIHPPVDDKLRAYCSGNTFNKYFLYSGGNLDVLSPKPYLNRNRDIVNASDLMIVAPKDAGLERSKGGTWYTQRYAVTTKTNHIIVFPNGDTEVNTYD